MKVKYHYVFLVLMGISILKASAQSYKKGPGLVYGYTGITYLNISTTADFEITGLPIGQYNSSLSLENDLNFSSNTPSFFIKAIAGGRFQAAVSYSSLRRSGEGDLTRTFTFGDYSYTAGSHVKGYLNTDYYSASLRLSIIHNPLATAGFSLGARYLKASAGIDANLAGEHFISDDSYDVPFLVPGIHGSIYALEGFLVRGSLEYFELKMFGTKGSAVEANITAEYYLLRNLGAGIGYSYTNLGVDDLPENSVYLKKINYRLQGLSLFAAFRF